MENLEYPFREDRSLDDDHGLWYANDVGMAIPGVSETASSETDCTRDSVFLRNRAYQDSPQSGLS